MSYTDAQRLDGDHHGPRVQQYISVKHVERRIWSGTNAQGIVCSSKAGGRRLCKACWDLGCRSCTSAQDLVRQSHMLQTAQNCSCS